MIRVPCYLIHQYWDQSWVTIVDENSQEPQDRMITYIDKSPREPPVPHNLDNKESLGSNFSTLGGSERDRGRYRGSTIFVINWTIRSEIDDREKTKEVVNLLRLGENVEGITTTTMIEA